MEQVDQEEYSESLKVDKVDKESQVESNSVLEKSTTFNFN